MVEILIPMPTYTYIDLSSTVGLVVGTTRALYVCLETRLKPTRSEVGRSEHGTAGRGDIHTNAIPIVF